VLKCMYRRLSSTFSFTYSNIESVMLRELLKFRALGLFLRVRGCVFIQNPKQRPKHVGVPVKEIT
jgi:hypothetical protein